MFIFGRHFKELRSCRIRASSRGFSLVQISIATLIMSSLGMGFTSYMKKQNAELRKSDLRDGIRTSGGLAQKILMDDIKQSVFLNPSCSTNQASSAATTACTNIQIRGGVTPLPGVSKESVNSMTSFGLPSNLNDSSASLSFSSDAIRLVMYDYSSTWGCKLNPRHSGSNPSTSLQRLWLQRSACLDASNNIRVAQGKLYIIVQSFGSSSPLTYSNIFQITSAPLDQGSVLDDIQIDISSTSNLYNQSGALGTSGFTGEARIFPVKLVEWAVSSSGGLYRREVKPTAADTTGFQSWTAMQKNVEGVQFSYVTASPTSTWTHNRTLTWTADTSNGVSINNGIEDIRGITPWIVMKSDKPTPDATTDDNPLTAEVESDGYSRRDSKFFVDFRNFAN